MEAITIYVCPQCHLCTVSTNPTHRDGEAVCMGIPTAGTWVPETAFPAVIDQEGNAVRLPKGDLEVIPIVQPIQPDDDRQAVVKPKDGDERYWDDEQEKLGR